MTTEATKNPQAVAAYREQRATTERNLKTTKAEIMKAARFLNASRFGWAGARILSGVDFTGSTKEAIAEWLALYAHGVNRMSYSCHAMTEREARPAVLQRILDTIWEQAPSTRFIDAWKHAKALRDEVGR